ncbi:MAG: winged helix-turn-helix transcriptional regulator [Chloroflexi bacterium]|nr:winged helix-turn-helix transcriptional regulator [Chloroflexota bacterium]
MTTDKQAAKKRAELLKHLRAEHQETVKRTQTLLKEHKQIHRDICQLIRENAKTVPEIAEATNMPTSNVLWHITALKKYDVIVEDGMCGDYVLYKRVEE